MPDLMPFSISIFFIFYCLFLFARIERLKNKNKILEENTKPYKKLFRLYQGKIRLCEKARIYPLSASKSYCDEIAVCEEKIKDNERLIEGIQ